jgi:D-proline reductase (dithiol) PrdB
MARPEDIPEPTRTAVTTVPCPSFGTTPFVEGPPLAQRRIAIITSAALIKRGELPFHFGSTEYRTVPADRHGSDILMSHVSINFDRSGFQRDINTVYPIDRLRELAAGRRDRWRRRHALYHHGLV